jgi:hypothetical protein
LKNNKGEKMKDEVREREEERERMRERERSERLN